MGSARVRLHRRRTPYADRARAYRVVIDGENVGEIRHGEEKTFEVPPGDHRLELRIDWGRSRPIELRLSGGEEVKLVCHGRNPLLALYWITAGRSRYIGLKEAGAAS